MAWLHGFEVQGSGRKRGAVSAERGQLSWSLSGLQAQPTPQHPSIDEPPPEPKLPLAALPLPCAPQADGHAAITPVPCLRVACSGDWEGESAPCWQGRGLRCQPPKLLGECIGGSCTHCL